MQNSAGKRGDAETFGLQVQFLRAHGLPRGEVTTLYAGGVFLSDLKRHEQALFAPGP